MKKSVFKAIVAAVCVVAAGMGGIKAYNAGNQSEANMLLSENIEALSGTEKVPVCIFAYGGYCVQNINGQIVVVPNMRIIYI